MRLGLYASVFVAAFAAVMPAAQAQDAADAAEARGNEIVVTAQRREQSLQDVSIAVTAVGNERLETAQIHNIEDLQLVVPSIYLGNDFNMAKTFIRGVGANTSTTGSETGVAMHVDGVFIARAEAQLLSLFDLERVEVLRGPQGTLYGRNAVGGSINLITAKPTHAWEGYARGTVGNYGAINADMALGGPLIGDAILGRFAFSSQVRDGFGENPVTGHDVDDLNRQMARGHLMFELSDDFDILLSGEYYTQDDASRALKFRRESYPGLVRLRALGISPAGVRGYATDPRDLASEIDPKTETEAWATTATTNWRLNDVFKLTNITSYREIDGYILQDLDVSSVVNSLAANGQNTTVQRRDIFSQQFSSELQLTFESEGINGVLGAFYFNENQKPVDTIDADPLVGQPHILGVLANPATGTFPPIGPTGLQVDGIFVAPTPISLTGALNTCNTFDRQDDVGVPGQALIPKRVCIASDLQSDSWAVFGQVVFNLGRLSPGLEPFSIKLGGRYSNETVSAANPSIIIARNGLGPIVQTTTTGSFNEREFESFTPEIGVEWRPTEDILVYYTYSEGFKAGAGQNGAPDANSGWISLIVDPEEIQNHEAGFRSTWADGRLTFNAAAFSYELQGQQINKTLPGGPAGFSTIWQNAAQTSAEGVELELSAAPTDRFRFNGSVTWLDSKYDDFVTVDPLDPRNVSTAGPCPAADPVSTCFVAPNGVSIQLAGNRTRNSPEWSANLHAEVDLAMLADGGMITAMGDVTYRDDVFFTEFQRLLEGEEAYTILDFNVRYVSGGDHFTLDAWIKNATDELVSSSTFALATARTLGVTYLPPQTYGVTLGYRF